MNKKDLFFLLIFFFVFVEFSFSQEILEIVPKGVESASLGKYGDSKANPNTGGAEANIPIYEIKVGNITVPITLDYVSGSGVKVDEKATWVGLGWKLNAGGAVTRSVVGGDDFGNYGFQKTIVPTLPNLTNNYRYNALFFGYDTEPDQFSYFVPAQSGKFIFENNGSPIFIESSSSKISYSNGDFYLTDGSGNSYQFTLRETISQTVNSAPVAESPSGQTSSNVQTWYLTKIISQDRIDTINFKYREYAQGIYQEYFRFFQSYDTGWFPPGGSYRYLREISMNQVTSQYVPYYLDEIEFPNGKVIFNSIGDRKDGGGLRLGSISIFSKDVNGYSKVKDFSFYSSYFKSTISNPFPRNSDDKNWRLRLDSLVELSGSNVKGGTHIFKYSDVAIPPINNFGQDHWGYNNGKSSNQTLLTAQRLVTPQEIVNIGNADREVDISAIEAGILKEIIYPTRGKTRFIYEPNQFRKSDSKEIFKSVTCIANGINNIQSTTFVADNFSNTTLRVEVRKIGDLTGLLDRPLVRLKDLTSNSIVYSGYAEAFNTQNYEIPILLTNGHTYEIYGEIKTNNPATPAYAGLTVSYSKFERVENIEMGFGLRVKEIENYDSNMLLSRKTIQYGKQGNGIGYVLSEILNQYPHKIDKILFQMVPDNNGGTCKKLQTNLQTLYYDGTLETLTAFNGSPLLYSDIAVYEENIQSSDRTKNGKVEYTYIIEPDHTRPTDSYYPGAILNTPYPWANSKLLSESYYELRDNNYFLRKRVNNTYDDVLGKEGRGLKMRYSEERLNCQSNTGEDIYYTYMYPVVTGIRLLSKQEETEFDQTGENALVSKNTQYEYNDKYQVVKLNQSKSDGTTKRIEYSYTNEKFKENTSNTTISQLYNQNILSLIFATKQFENNKLVSSIRADYLKSLPNIFGLSVIEQLDISENKWYTKISYPAYLKQGRPKTSISQGGLHTSYLWGYNGEYLVAEIKNATEQDVKNVLTQVEINNLNLPNVQQSTIDAVMAKLRANLPKAMVTSYTYKPLVGMTSKTDARGIKETYTYDGMQRLQTILDHLNYVTKSFDYHYRPN